ncbi:hypothetical protein VR010_05975 [Actinomycetaceae bacterium L2_0104]
MSGEGLAAAKGYVLRAPETLTGNIEHGGLALTDELTTDIECQGVTGVTGLPE